MTEVNMKKTTKLDAAIAEYKTGKYKTNSEFVKYLVETLGMSKLGARTYAYNVKKKVGDWAVNTPVDTKFGVILMNKPKTVAKKAPKKTKVIEHETFVPPAEPVVGEDDPLAIPDFLDRRRTKAEQKLQAE